MLALQFPKFNLVRYREVAIVQTGNFGLEMRLMQPEILSMVQHYMWYSFLNKIEKNTYMGRTMYFNFLQSHRCQNHAKFTSNLTSHAIQLMLPSRATVVCRPREAYAARGRPMSTSGPGPDLSSTRQCQAFA